MKPYLTSIAAGLLDGVIYNLINVHSPAPPLIALITTPIRLASRSSRRWTVREIAIWRSCSSSVPQ